jgi:hypothetical protein
MAISCVRGRGQARLVMMIVTWMSLSLALIFNIKSPFSTAGSGRSSADR